LRKQNRLWPPWPGQNHPYL